MSKTPEELFTSEENAKFRAWAIKKSKFLEGLIDDLSDKINNQYEATSTLVDEAVDRAERAQRALRRHEKDNDHHEHDEK